MVLACGMCGDMLFSADVWWAAAAGPPFLALLLAALASTFVTKSAYGAVFSGLAFGALAVSSFVFGALRGLWVASSLLLVGLIISLLIHKVPRWFNVARVTLVVAAMVSSFIDAQPWNRETSDLLRVALYVQRFEARSSWLYGELLSRGEFRGLLEAKLMREDGANEQAVGLHRELGFPALARQEACHALRPDGREKACPGE